jgi:hypothetical protein
MYDVAQYALHFALHFSGNVMQHTNLVSSLPMIAE